MRSIAANVGLTLGILLAGRAGATTAMLFTPSQLEAREAFHKWAFGVSPPHDVVAELREIVEDDSADGEGRAAALEYLVWVDIGSDELDLRDLIRHFATRTDVSKYVNSLAKGVDLQLKVFGRGLGETALLAKLRAISNGRVVDAETGRADPLWAAKELCARGYMDATVRNSYARRFSDGGKTEIADCERQREFLLGPRDEQAVLAALRVPDPSKSQAFRIEVLRAGLKLEGNKAQRTRLMVRQLLGKGEPAEVVAMRDTIFELARGAETREQLWARGMDPQVAALVLKSRARGGKRN